VIRPRGVIGAVRSRGPLPIVLCVAAAEGRLVWQSESSFAVLERPAAVPGPRLLVTPGLRLLRLLDRRWDLLVFAVPPVVLLAASVPVALLSGSPLLGVLLAVAAASYVCALMLAQVVWQLAWFRRFLGRRQPAPDEIAEESLPGWNWSMPLLHHEPAEGGRALVERAMAQMGSLVRTEVAFVGRTHGGETQSIVVREVLVGLVRGATTSGMRRTLRSIMDTPYGPDARVVLRAPLGPVGSVREPVKASGGFFFEYVGGVAVILLICAYFISVWEYNACAATDCAGRPATFGAAAHYLAWRLFLQDPDGLIAATPQAMAIGWLTSLVGLMTLPVGFVSVTLAKQAHARSGATAIKFLRNALTKTRLMLLTVTDAERDAVLAAIHELTQQPPERSFEQNHVIYEFGMVRGVRVAMVQCPRQGGTGPGGSILTTAEVLQRWQPHFVVMVGICYGLGEDWPQPQRLGDVCISTAVEDLDRKILFESREEAQGDRATAPPVLVSRMKAASVDWSVAKVHSGLILTSGTLVSSKEHRDAVRAQHTRAIAGEMEGAGVYDAASAARVPWLLVRGISDWGYDRDKRYDATLAAGNAAALVAHALWIGAFDDDGLQH
jgi:nucleoside phosphorylase